MRTFWHPDVIRDGCRGGRHLLPPSIATALLLVALVGCGSSSNQSPTSFRLVWHDEFSGPAGAPVDSSNWLHDIGTMYPGGPPNWGTGEVETMTDDPANVSLDGKGHLAITPIRGADGGWTSARIETQRTDFEPPPGGAMAF